MNRDSEGKDVEDCKQRIDAARTSRGSEWNCEGRDEQQFEHDQKAREEWKFEYRETASWKQMPLLR